MPVTDGPKSIVSAVRASALAARIASRSEMPSAPGVAISAAIDVVVPLTTSFSVADRHIGQQPPVFQRLETQPPM